MKYLSGVFWGCIALFSVALLSCTPREKETKSSIDIRDAFFLKVDASEEQVTSGEVDSLFSVRYSTWKGAESKTTLWGVVWVPFSDKGIDQVLVIDKVQASGIVFYVPDGLGGVQFHIAGSGSSHISYRKETLLIPSISALSMHPVYFKLESKASYFELIRKDITSFTNDSISEYWQVGLLFGSWFLAAICVVVLGAYFKSKDLVCGGIVFLSLGIVLIESYGIHLIFPQSLVGGLVRHIPVLYSFWVVGALFYVRLLLKTDVFDPISDHILLYYILLRTCWLTAINFMGVTFLFSQWVDVVTVLVLLIVLCRQYHREPHLTQISGIALLVCLMFWITTKWFNIEMPMINYLLMMFAMVSVAMYMITQQILIHKKV